MHRDKKTKESIVHSDAALSEVLDFSITIGVMVLAVAVIAAAGYPMLQHMQERGHQLNIEQSFSVLQPNVNKIVYDKAPSQSVELKMYGSAVAITGNSYMNISMQVWNDTGLDHDTISIERQMRMIENRYAGNVVAYENTGIWARYPHGGHVLISNPGFAHNDDSLLVPMVTISGSNSVSGSGLTRIVANGGQISVSVYENVSKVDLTVKSGYYRGWGRYLNETLGMDIKHVDDVNNTLSVSRVYDPAIDILVTISPIRVDIE